MSISKNILAIIMAVAVVPLSSSCDAIYDDEGDCTSYCNVRFVYDRNMEFADAFSVQVRQVLLYVFDENGDFITRLDESGEALAASGYRMALPLEPGTYSVVAWCGAEAGRTDSYEVSAMTRESSNIADMHCWLTADAAEAATQGDEQQTRTTPTRTVGEIARLYHGMATFTLPDEEGRHTYTVELTKNTNDVRIVLQNTSGQPLDTDDFEITVTDDNGLLNYDNTPIPDELLTYVPWHTTTGAAGVGTDGNGGDDGTITQVNALVAELTVSRLYIDKETKPMLTVTHTGDDGTRRTVLSIPLIDYALLVKGNYNRDMDDQEYLDRQDEYNMTFFLDENNNWISSSIIINSWRVVLIETEL